MQLEPECIGCLFNQLQRAFKMVKPEINNEIIINAQKDLMKYLIEAETDKISAPLVGNFVYKLISKYLGINDPYKKLKDKYNELALQYYDEIKEIVKNSEDKLFEALAAAALGNTVDFAGQHEIDLINDIKNFSSDDFKVNEYDDFKKSLNKIYEEEGELLILGDNTGEIVFDKLLVEIIQELYPNIEIVYSVRSIPIINDATMEDAKFINLTKIIKVIEASPVPGIDLTSATEEFKEHFFHPNGMILSKGQGNFETLHGMDIPNKDLYYLLKAKCNLMERIFNVKIGDLIFKKKTSNF